MSRLYWWAYGICLQSSFACIIKSLLLIFNRQAVGGQSSDSFQAVISIVGGATAGKAPKVWALPRFWVSIHSYKKQQVKNIWGRILGLAWLKFAVAGAPDVS